MTNYFREDNKGIVRLTEDAPEFLIEYVRKAHDTEAPNNWVWEKCAYFWGTLCEDDDMDEAIDAAVDIWWADLFQWLADMPLSRKHYCDRALDEGVADGSDFANIVIAGQYLQLCEIAELMREAYDQATVGI